MRTIPSMISNYQAVLVAFCAAALLVVVVSADEQCTCTCEAGGEYQVLKDDLVTLFSEAPSMVPSSEPSTNAPTGSPTDVGDITLAPTDQCSPLFQFCDFGDTCCDDDFGNRYVCYPFADSSGFADFGICLRDYVIPGNSPESDLDPFKDPTYECPEGRARGETIECKCSRPENANDPDCTRFLKAKQLYGEHVRRQRGLNIRGSINGQ